MKRRFYVVVEQDETGCFIASVPELRGCLTQGRTADEAGRNIVEAIQLYLDEPQEVAESTFVGIHRVEVAA